MCVYVFPQLRRRGARLTDRAPLAFTRYYHHQYCMVYGINRGAYIAQWPCNSIVIG